MLHISPNGMSDKLQNGEQKIVSLSGFMSCLFLLPVLPPPLSVPLLPLSIPSLPGKVLQYLLGNPS